LPYFHYVPTAGPTIFEKEANTMRTLMLAAAFCCAFGAARAEPTAHSQYTSLDAGCKMLWHAAANEPLPDSFNSICPGRDGMRVILEGGDARSWIGLLPRGAKYDQGKRLYANWGGFPEVTGKRLEWRYHGPKLAALIVRMEWTEQSNADDTKVVSGLVIWRVNAVKLGRTCVIGQTTSNEEAQAIADDLNKRCLES
jgi:hypothetical protein